MQEVELAWCAGFFDGEGCFTLQRLKKQRFGMSLHLSQHGKQKELLDRWIEWLDLKPHGMQYLEVRPQGNPIWRLRVHAHDQLWRIAMLLWPWLSQYRKEQFSQMWTQWESWRDPDSGRRPGERTKQRLCKRGHDLGDPDNVYLYRGVRFCRACRALRREGLK